MPELRRFSAEQLGDGDLLVDTLDGLCKHGGHLQVFDLAALFGINGGDGVQQGQLGDDAVVDPVNGRAGEHAVGGAGLDALGAAHLDQGLGGVAQAAAGVHHVVEEDAVLVPHVADDVHDLAAVGLLPALVHDGQIHVQLLGKGPGPGHRAHVGRDHHHVLALGAVLLGVVVHKDGVARQIVHRNVEEALDLGGVQVHGQHPVRARGGEHVGHQLGGDGVTGLGLAVLPGIAEIRDDGGDAAGGGTLHCVDHDQQLHEAVIDRLAGALHDEHVHAADGLVDGDGALAVGKRRDRALAQGDAEVLADHVRQVGVGRAGEHLDLFAVWNHIVTSSLFENLRVLRADAKTQVSIQNHYSNIFAACKEKPAICGKKFFCALRQCLCNLQQNLEITKNVNAARQLL